MTSVANGIRVAIDGPSGSGKSSVSKKVAAHLGIGYLDTGAMYRALTWYCLDRGIDLDDLGAVADAVTARALRAQPEVARTFAQLSSVTKAVVGIGRWGPEQSTVFDAASPEEQRALHALGVCADVSGVFVDGNGDAVDAELTERMIVVSAEQLRSVPEVIGIAYGVQKAPAVRSAMRGGLVDGLVTHAPLARALLARPDAWELVAFDTDDEVPSAFQDWAVIGAA